MSDSTDRDLRVENDQLRRELDDAKRGWALGLAQAIRGGSPLEADNRAAASCRAAKILFGAEEAARLFPSDDERMVPSDEQRPCAQCGHEKRSHLDETDRGWCTKPAGTCIYDPCSCTAFVDNEDP